MDRFFVLLFDKMEYVLITSLKIIVGFIAVTTVVYSK